MWTMYRTLNDRASEKAESQSLRCALSAAVILALAGLASAGQVAFERTGWTARTKQLFEHPPVFEFTTVPGAVSYHFTITGPDGRAETRETVLPRVDLNTLWPDLPPTGEFTLEAQARSKELDKALAVLSLTFTKKEPFQGKSLPKKTDYRDAGFKCVQFMMDTLAGRREELRSFAVKPGGVHGWPGLFYSAQIRLLATGATFGSAEIRQEAITHIATFTDWLIQRNSPEDWAWPNCPPTQSIHGENTVIQPARLGLLGEAYLDAYAVNHDPRVLDAAMKMADTLKARQKPVGRWPFRVNAQTGETVIDYTSDQVEVVTFLERLIADHGRADLQPTVDRAVTWTLANPARTYRWEGQYDDMAGFDPYQGLEWYDTGFFILYLLRHADELNGYQGLAEDLLRYIEDQFIVWGFSPEYITPGALEQYNCYQFVDYSIAHYIRICMGFHRATGNNVYLRKAKVMANTLTQLQHPDGWFACQHPTHAGDASKPGQLGTIQWRPKWGLNYLPNCSAYAAEMLIRFDAYLRTLESCSE